MSVLLERKSSKDFPSFPHLILPEVVIRLNPGTLSRKDEPDDLKKFLPQDRPYLQFFIMSETMAKVKELKPWGERFVVPASEEMAANILSLNNSLLIPPRCPQTKEFLQTHF